MGEVTKTWLWRVQGRSPNAFDVLKRRDFQVRASTETEARELASAQWENLSIDSIAKTTVRPIEDD